MPALTIPLHLACPPCPFVPLVGFRFWLAWFCSATKAGDFYLPFIVHPILPHPLPLPGRALACYPAPFPSADLTVAVAFAGLRQILAEHSTRPGLYARLPAVASGRAVPAFSMVGPKDRRVLSVGALLLGCHIDLHVSQPSIGLSALPAPSTFSIDVCRT